MNKSFRRNRRAVSPVIATIIIVAVAIVMSIAVAYWMLGLAGTFTRYEKLEFVSAYATKVQSWNWSETENDEYSFNITITLKNTGSAAATIDTIFINGVPHTDAAAQNGYAILYIAFDSTKFIDNTINSNSASNGTLNTAASCTVNPGEEVTGVIALIYGGTLPTGDVITSGVTIEIMIQTAAGNQYPKSVTLP